MSKCVFVNIIYKCYSVNFKIYPVYKYNELYAKKMLTVLIC